MKTKFIAHMIGTQDHASGYTPSQLVELKAGTYQKALAELREKILGDWYEEDDYGLYDDCIGDLDYVHIYEISDKKDAPLDRWYKEKENREKAFRKKASREGRRKLYKNLKVEFE